jgi:hypothetical protein
VPNLAQAARQQQQQSKRRASAGALLQAETGPDGRTRWGGYGAANNNAASSKPEFLSPRAKRMEELSRYQRGSDQRPGYEKRVMAALRTEKELEGGLAAAKTEMQAVEAGLKVGHGKTVCDKDSYPVNGS